VDEERAGGAGVARWKKMMNESRRRRAPRRSKA
jgi:hypothetical protein